MSASLKLIFFSSSAEKPTTSPGRIVNGQRLEQHTRELERAFGAKSRKLLTRMEATCLVPFEPFFRKRDRLVLRLEYTGTTAVRVSGQEFERTIARATDLDGLLQFEQPDLVKAFLSGLGTA